MAKSVSYGEVQESLTPVTEHDSENASNSQPVTPITPNPKQKKGKGAKL